MNEPTVYRSRWGWHPCDYTTFKELKEFHRLILRDFIASRRFERWSAKLPQHRIRRLKDGSHVGIPEPQRLGTDRREYAWALTEYQEARRPKPTPDDVRPLDLPHGWQEKAEALRAFYEAL
jgi:hypothetical protein